MSRWVRFLAATCCAVLSTLPCYGNFADDHYWQFCVTNTSGQVADCFHATFSGTGGTIKNALMDRNPGGNATITGSMNTITITFADPGLAIGQQICFKFSTLHPSVALVGGEWTHNGTVTGTFDDTAGTFKEAEAVEDAWATLGSFGPDSQPILSAPIGKFVVTKNGSAIDIDFLIDPSYAYLDDWYDFRWINVVTAYTTAAGPQAQHPLVGPLPAIDPAPWDGPEPYYYNAAEWAAGKFGDNITREEGRRSKYRDARFSSVGDVNFTTFLVADSITDEWLDTEFCVLSGYEWVYHHATNDVTLTGAVPPDIALVNQALDNGRTDTTPDHPGEPGYPDWVALQDCSLPQCWLYWLSTPSSFIDPFRGFYDTIVIDDDTPISDLRIGVHALHPLVEQLSVQLFSPDGTSIVLHNGAPSPTPDLYLFFAESGLPYASMPFDFGGAMQPAGPGSLSDLEGLPAFGEWTLYVSDDTPSSGEGVLQGWSIAYAAQSAADQDPVFLRGDANDDGAINVADGIWTLTYFFGDGTPPSCFAAGDANGDTSYNVADAIWLFNYTFLGGAPPAAPFPSCGSVGPVDCESSSCMGQ